jgi:2-(1,2-epoxy-1,2-dihydrophenyl)acetyl-CoA isomerase
MLYMSSIIFEVKNHIAFITLNRPEKFNAFNREMALAFQTRLDEIASDTSIRAVHLTGAGKAFSAGQDIAELTGENPPPIEKILSEHYNPIVTRIRNLNRPVICAVNGVAAGAGANIALSCDIVLASTSASFIQAFSKIGLIPDSGGTFMLPRLIGWQKASALMMLGDKVTAEEAEKLGMIYKVYNDDLFIAETLKVTNTLAEMPTTALALIKKTLNASFVNNLQQQLQLEDQSQREAGSTSDYREGIDAFIAKRPATFTGR